MARYGRRRTLTPAETAANAAAREARKQAAMTCQICGRAYLANTGVIAHHGYERPGEGWQTSSCSGARAAPFEVSRNALELEIENAKRQMAGARALAADTDAERIPVRWQYADKTLPKDSRGKRQIRYNSITRDLFPAEFAEYLKRSDYAHVAKPTFDSLKARQVKSYTDTANNLQSYIEAQTIRFEAWSQTHERRDGQWAKLPA